MTTVLYHANCYDGFGAAWSAYQSLGPNAKYQPVKYGDAIPDLPDGERVYIVDFSYPRDVLVPLAERVDLTVLDHHKTAEADLHGLPFCTFDMERSGASLTWDHFHGTPVPLFIRHIEDRDLWRWAIPYSREVHAWLTSWPMDFETWDRLADEMTSATGPREIYREGTALLRLEHQQTERIADHARMGELAGYTVPIVTTPLLFSEVPELLCERYPDAAFAAYYLDRADGKRQWGLRSRGEFDVSDVARQFGGGGHKNAAGFIENTP